MTAAVELIDILAELELAAAPLEPDAAERARLREAATASAERFLEGIARQPAFVEAEHPAEALLGHPIAESGLPLDQVIELIEREVIAPGGHPASPGHLAYIPGGAIYHSALADFLAAVSNKYPGLFFTGPGPVRLEQVLIRWAADLMGYPGSAAGQLTSGGSLATLAAVTAARDAHGLRAADFAECAVYLTDQAHHCIEKALRIAGMGEAVIRRVPMDQGWRMRPEALAELIERDRAWGLRPWLVVGAAGTTDTGAVDPLAALGRVARAAGCWYHVDAAYGGFFRLTDYGRRLLTGIEQSDSVVLDPHKGLFLPFGIGMVLLRHPAAVSARPDAHYLQDAAEEPGELAGELALELSKHFRALRMWLPLMLLGTEPFRAALEEKLLLARYFRRRVAELGFEVGPEPDLSIVTFRWAPPGLPDAEADAINRRIVEQLRRDGRIFLSSTTLNGRFVIRLAVLAFRTHRETIELAVRLVGEMVGGEALTTDN